MQYKASMQAEIQAMQPMQASTTDTRNGKTSPRLEITTPAARNSVVTVELEPVVNGGGRENTAMCKVKVLGYNLQG